MFFKKKRRLRTRDTAWRPGDGIGILLLVVGGAVSAPIGLGLEVAIAAHSALALLGAVLAIPLKHAQEAWPLLGLSA